MQENGELWTYQDLCRRLSIRPGTAYAWVSQGRVPHIRLSGKLVRFDPERIEEWLEEKERDPMGVGEVTG